jgi:hypothetical protein
VIGLPERSSSLPVWPPQRLQSALLVLSVLSVLRQMVSLRQRRQTAQSQCSRDAPVCGSWNRRWLLVVVRRD